LIHKLKREYPGDKSAAYATAWKISKLKNRKGKKHKKAEKSVSVSESNSEGSGSVSVSDGEVRVRAETKKAEPGPMSPGGLLQIGHQKPTVPTASTDKHPQVPPAQPVVMHPPESPVVTGPLKKDLFGLPGPASTPQQMSQQLTKNVFKMMKMCKTNDVIGTTFKAENPSDDPMVKLKDANSKDTGSGGQIQKGKLKKDLNVPVKTRAFSPLVSVRGNNQPEHAKPSPIRTSPTLVPRPQYKTPAHKQQAHFSQMGAGTEQTQAGAAGGGHIVGNTIKVPRMDDDHTAITKPPMAKGALSGMGNMPKDMQQMASAHASASAPKPGAVAAPKASMPTQASHAQRASSHQAALGGEFQPKGPINSGLELASPMKKQAMPPVGAGAATLNSKVSPLKKPMAKALPMLPGVGKQGMPGKSQPAAPKLSQQTLVNKNAKMPAAQKSVKPI
jgi:hypothetical protein